MASGKWISYLRVSTKRQGSDGLGIEAQRAAVNSFLNGGDWTLLQEFVEVESGARCDRPKLAEAMRLCRLHRAKLIIARLDRLARDAHFLLGLEKAGIDFVCADNPHATRFTIGVLALVAEEERRLLRVRTKAALAAAKARGVKLGGARPNGLSVQCREKSVVVRKQHADARAADIMPAITAIQQGGATSLHQIAAGLNAQGIPTPRGAERWRPAQVARVLKRGVG